MGSAYYVVLEQPKLDIDITLDGKALAKSSRSLSRICKQLGLCELEHFVSSNPQDLENMLDDLDVDMELPMPEEQWFMPEEGLKWLSRIMDHLSKQSETTDLPQALLSDLQTMQSILHKAQAADTRWHLAVDF